MDKEELRRRLFALQDPKYREFQCRLMPTVNPDTVIGVRTPALRTLAKECSPEDARHFLDALPHAYYEENNLHGILLSRLKGPSETIAELDRFLPYVDNWATCDLISPRCFRRHPPELLSSVRRWLSSGAVYTVRFGIGVLLGFYLDEAFRPEYLDWAAAAISGDYYVDMMVAWYFATALAKQYESALPYLENGRLSLFVHNKTIQKAVESYRVSGEHKAYLRTLRRK